MCLSDIIKLLSVQVLRQMLTHPFDYHTQGYAIHCGIFLRYFSLDIVHTFWTLLMRCGVLHVFMQHSGNHVFRTTRNNSPACTSPDSIKSCLNLCKLLQILYYLSFFGTAANSSRQMKVVLWTNFCHLYPY